MNQISDGFWSETAWQAVEPEYLACSVVTPLPPSLPFPCFPDVVAELLGTLLAEEGVAKRTGTTISEMVGNQSRVNRRSRTEISPVPNQGIRIVSHGSFWTELWQDRQAV